MRVESIETKPMKPMKPIRLTRIGQWLASLAFGDRAFWKWRHHSQARECAAALPVVRGQILEASRHAESAIGEICTSFQSIADRSRLAVEEAAGMLSRGATEGLSVEQSVDTSRSTITGLMERMEKAAQFSAMAVASMEAVEAGVAGMEALLQEVERIAFASKLVALNAKIEAVHVGEMGAGFEVVADEISRQAERTNELTDGIANRIQEARRCAQEAAGHLRQSVADESASREASRRNAEQALHVLVSVHRHAQDSVALMTGEYGRLREEVAKAVVHLQFQDRFTQRISHVADVLEQMEKMLNGQPVVAGKSLLEGLQESYSMHEERQVQAALENSAPVAAASGGEVELF